MAANGGVTPGKAKRRGPKAAHHIPIGDAMHQPGLESSARGTPDMADAMKQGSIGKSSGVNKTIASRSGH